MNNSKSARKKILIVDDEGDMLKLTRKRLEVNGYSIVTLQNGSHTLEMAKSGKPDLILLDVVMPVKNGCDICKELKSDEMTRDIPVILFTAHYPEKNFLDINYSEFGADDWIAKPYDDELLLKKIERLIK